MQFFVGTGYYSQIKTDKNEPNALTVGAGVIIR